MPARPVSQGDVHDTVVGSRSTRGATTATYSGARYDRKMATATPV